MCAHITSACTHIGAACHTRSGFAAPYHNCSRDTSHFCCANYHGLCPILSQVPVCEVTFGNRSGTLLARISWSQWSSMACDSVIILTFISLFASRCQVAGDVPLTLLSFGPSDEAHGLHGVGEDKKSLLGDANVSGWVSEQ
eukprot:scaffold14867_cov29-Tisochrysis_lutea.AAC.2